MGLRWLLWVVGVCVGQKCALESTLRLSLGDATELEMSLGADLGEDTRTALAVVEAHGLAEGGGCVDSACVAGSLVDTFRDVRESLMALDSGGDDVLTLSTTSRVGEDGRTTFVAAVATVGERYVSGLRSMGAKVCFSAKSPAHGLADTLQECVGAGGDGSYRGGFEFTGADPGVHTLYAFVDGRGRADGCASALKSATAEAFWYATDPATGSYWRGAWRDDAYTSDIGYPVSVAVGRGTYGVETIALLAYGGPETLRVGSFTSVGPNARSPEFFARAKRSFPVRVRTPS